MMKKDMGGAATVLALAHMIMEPRSCKLRLRVLIPAVENAISGAAFRPLDVYRFAQGHHRRGRQHRCRRPADPRRRAGAGRRGSAGLLVDMATLTGAARVALGPELPPFYTNDEALAADARCARPATENDPLWRLPLWQPYDAHARFQGRRHQQRRRRAASPARSPARCSSAFCQPPPRAGCTSISTPGTPAPSPAGPRAASVRRRARSMRYSWNAMADGYDPRLTPARPDLAAKHLRGKVKAARFVEGTAREVLVASDAGARRAVARRAAAHRSAAR